MTIIIGYETDKGTYLAGDRLGSTNFTGILCKNKKIFENGDFLFGVCGSYRMMQIIQYNFTPPKHHKDVDTWKYLIDNFLPELVNMLDKKYCLKQLNNIHTLDVGEFLFVYNGNLFRLQNDLSIIREINNFTLTGSGQYHGESVLSLLHEQSNNKKLSDKQIRQMMHDTVRKASEKVLSISDNIVDILFQPKNEYSLKDEEL